MNIVEYIKQFPLRTFERGELLLQKGDSIDTLLVIRSGYIKIVSITSTGTERLMWLAGRYDIAPTEQLFARRATTRFFYTALTDGSYYEVDKKAFLQAAQEHPELMAEIARGMALHYDDFLYRVDAVDAATIKGRLLRTLCYLSERLGASDNIDFYDYGLHLTHNDLASLIGSTRETTSLTLSELRKEGLIDYNRHHFTVHTSAMKLLLDETD